MLDSLAGNPNGLGWVWWVGVGLVVGWVWWWCGFGGGVGLVVGLGYIGVIWGGFGDVWRWIGSDGG